jgi:hypothetical protein
VYITPEVLLKKEYNGKVSCTSLLAVSTQCTYEWSPLEKLFFLTRHLYFLHTYNVMIGNYVKSISSVTNSLSLNLGC